jgi:signal transduction histidine kinase
MSLAVHELRTPVTVVSGYLRMLLREQGGPLSATQKKMLEEADRSCSRINALVSEMSDLGKLESGDIAIGRTEFDLAALINEVARDMHEGSDRGVHLEVRGAENPITMTGDRTRIAAALQALMHAALRERGEPGVVVVSCSVVSNAGDRAALVVIGDEPSSRLLAGGPPAQESFDEWRGGLGLALPIGRRVIEAHGGVVWSAPQTPRAGSALRLPLHQGSQDR